MIAFIFGILSLLLVFVVWFFSFPPMFFIIGVVTGFVAVVFGLRGYDQPLSPSTYSLDLNSFGSKALMLGWRVGARNLVLSVETQDSKPHQIKIYGTIDQLVEFNKLYNQSRAMSMTKVVKYDEH